MNIDQCLNNFAKLIIEEKGPARAINIVASPCYEFNRLRYLCIFEDGYTMVVENNLVEPIGVLGTNTFIGVLNIAIDAFYIRKLDKIKHIQHLKIKAKRQRRKRHAKTI